MVLPWLVVGVGCWLGFQLVRQNGRILLRFGALEERLSQLMQAGTPGPTGLPVGSVAPPFELPDLNGHRLSLESFRGRRVLLIFFSPHCGYCVQMAPALAAAPWEGRDGRPTILVVATGDLEENRKLVKEHGIGCPVLLQAQSEVGNLYRADGTPMGYLIDERGAIASELAVGGSDVLALADRPSSAGNGGGGAAAAHGNGEKVIGAGGDADHLRHERRELKQEIKIPLRLIPAEGIGVGDLIKRATDAIGMKACHGCERRRQVFNRWVVKGSGIGVGRVDGRA